MNRKTRPNIAQFSWNNHFKNIKYDSTPVPKCPAKHINKGLCIDKTRNDCLTVKNCYNLSNIKKTEN